MFFFLNSLASHLYRSYNPNITQNNFSTLNANYFNYFFLLKTFNPQSLVFLFFNFVSLLQSSVSWYLRICSKSILLGQFYLLLCSNSLVYYLLSLLLQFFSIHFYSIFCHNVFSFQIYLQNILCLSPTKKKTTLQYKVINLTLFIFFSYTVSLSFSRAFLIIFFIIKG